MSRHNPNGPSQRLTKCPCGCNGYLAYHDDRSWGPWQCPTCGEDSDADYGKPCAACVDNGLPKRRNSDTELRDLERRALASGRDIAAWADYESAARRTGSSVLEAKVLADGDVMDWLLFSAVMNRLGLSLLRPEYEAPLRAALAPVEGRDPSGRRVEVPREHWGQLQVLWKLRTDLEDARWRREFPLMNVIDQHGLKADVYRLSAFVTPREPGDEIDGSRGNYLVKDRILPTDYWYPSGLSSGDYSGGDARTRSNREIFLERFGETEGVHPVVGYGFNGVGIRLDVTNPRVIAVATASLDDDLDPQGTARLDQDERDEAWSDWIKNDFKRALSDAFGVELDEVEDSALRSFFDTYAEDSDWSSTGQGAQIRVDDVVRRVSSESLDDLLSPPTGNPSRHRDWKLVELKRSHIRGKKWKAVFEDGRGRTKTTHFGATGYEDYTMHGDLGRKRRYLERHGRGHENWEDPTTAGALSRWVLWNKPTIEASVADFKRRFGV